MRWHRTLANLQMWLQGYPNKPRPRAALLLGNGISNVRYWSWRLFTREGWRSP